MFEEDIQEIETMRGRLGELRAALNVEGMREEAAALEQQMAAQGFWNDPEAAQEVVQKMKGLKSVLETPDTLARELEDARALAEMAQEEEDESMGEELARMRDTLSRKLDRLEINSLFTDPRDKKPALVGIHPGAGGTESCDWAEMLYRMVTRFCEQHDFEYEVLEYQPGDEAGLKSAALRVTGLNAYGTLKSEAGVHRLVRISPFDASSRRHTSFTAIEVLTEVDEDINIEVREEDLKMDVYRSSGKGGQKVNKTSSAVRLTHLPTGFVVSCQVERSQHRNRATALQMLKAKLYDVEMRRQAAEIDAQREGHQDVAWGSQIRSYVLQPYQMVKDHRTSAETSNVQRVLDGDLDMFIEAYLKWDLERKSRHKHKAAT